MSSVWPVSGSWVVNAIRFRETRTLLYYTVTDTLSAFVAAVDNCVVFVVLAFADDGILFK